MNGSLPPSSSTLFLMLRPACSATGAPARSLPVSERVVPRLHGEQRPERFNDQHGVACNALERPRRREPGAVATVVVEDLRGQVGLLTRLDDPLAHLQRDERREPVALLGQQFPRAMDDRGTLLDGPVTPGAEGLVRGLDGAVDGSRVEAVELPHDLPGVGIHRRVVMGRRCRHGRASCPVRASRKWGVDSPRGRRVDRPRPVGPISCSR
jgi:hypothetical protein